MFSKRTWIVVALIIVGWAVWHSNQTLEFVYSVRYTDEGARESKIICGEAPSIIFLGEFNEDVRGPATGADCQRAARSRLVEGAGLLLVAVVVGWVGYKYGSESPRPIDTELPRLPDGSDRIVNGRKRKD